MSLNPKFVKFEKNNDPQAKFLGIATVSICDDQLLIRYKVQQGKGNGTYFAPMSIKMNDEWIQGHLIDSNIANEEIMSVIRKNLNRQPPQYESLPRDLGKVIVDDESVPF